MEDMYNKFPFIHNNIPDFDSDIISINCNDIETEHYDEVPTETLFSDSSCTIANVSLGVTV